MYLKCKKSLRNYNQYLLQKVLKQKSNLKLCQKKKQKQQS